MYLMLIETQRFWFAVAAPAFALRKQIKPF